MRRFDFQPPLPIGSSGSGSGPAGHSGSWSAVESSRTAPAHGDFLEEHPSAWEMAWIDLGGEG
ncbi:MAG: hypothetical protein JO112_03005 [Planctomycetes bacterium]|nr:hypothetical protein [Planctomycetota bacterium]